MSDMTVKASPRTEIPSVSVITAISSALKDPAQSCGTGVVAFSPLTLRICFVFHMREVSQGGYS